MAITLLKLTYKLVFLAIDHIKIVVCQFAPLYFGFTFQLVPFPFKYVVIHDYQLLEIYD
ncbi:hypothetical protein D3C80_1911250 [compost metagenome]